MVSSDIFTLGGVLYPNPPRTKLTASRAPSVPKIGFPTAPIPEPPVIYILAGKSFGLISPGLSPLILRHPSAFDGLFLGIRSAGSSAFTSLMFKNLVLSLFVTINLTPGFNAAYLLASRRETPVTYPLSGST